MNRKRTEIKRFIFFTEEPFITYFGQNYESTVLHANRHCIPVIRIINANGTHSAIPLERANGLLEKYYRLKEQQMQEVYHANLNEMTPLREEDDMVFPAEEKTLISGAA